MAKIFVTGAADGLGQLAAKQLIKDGHEVVLHARNQQRGEQAIASLPGAKEVLTGDLADIDQTKELAEKANAFGTFDAVIHNAGVYQAGKEELLHINTLAPYILTALMHRPQRLIYLSSGMHLSGNPQRIDSPSYADTKLHVLMLAKILSRFWPEVYANAVDPGWVPTKMGGAGAPDDLDKGWQTQVWLATSPDREALVSGQYFHHQKPARYHQQADNKPFQDVLLNRLVLMTGITLKQDA